MDKDKKVTEINAHDDMSDCFSDCVGGQCNIDRRPKGYVEIFDVDKEGNKKLVSKSNLILYTGREFISSRILNTVNTNIPQDPSEYLCWFGIGSGGTPETAPFSPIAPRSDSTGLTNEIWVNETDASCGDQREDGRFYKHPFYSVTPIQDPSNDDKYLITLVQITLSDADANGQIINEAALYTATSNAAGFGGPFHIFAKVTFPSITKDSGRVLVFNWYLYF